MPTISSAQLSDISERTEYTTKSQLKQEYETEKRDITRRHSEFSPSNFISDGEISGKSSPNSVIEKPTQKPRLTVQSSMKNEIEINVHKASTISDE